MKNSNPMTGQAELKRVAEAASQGLWGQDGFEVQNDDINDYRVARCSRLADAKFIAAAGPATVLALIAENERLERLALDSVNAEYAGSMDLESICAERDQLRAEVAGLRTGYEAYEQVNAEMKAEIDRSTEREILQLAEIEALRKALESCADELSAEVICKHGGQKLEDMHPVTRRLYDRDMASVIDARAALGQGEQS